MKKILGIFALFFACSVAANAACMPGVTCTPATRYDVTLLEAALCQDAACTTPVVIGSGAKTFDIASVAVGASLGSFANFDTIPAGTYTHIRSVVSRTFTITGSAVATCLAQNAVTLNIPNGADPAIPVDAIAAAGQAWLTWNDVAKTQIKMMGTLPSPLVIPQTGTRPSVSIAFGTQTALGCTGGGLSLPQPPEIVVSIQ